MLDPLEIAKCWIFILSFILQLPADTLLQREISLYLLFGYPVGQVIRSGTESSNPLSGIGSSGHQPQQEGI